MAHLAWPGHTQKMNGRESIEENDRYHLASCSTSTDLSKFSFNQLRVSPSQTRTMNVVAWWMRRRSWHQDYV